MKLTTATTALLLISKASGFVPQTWKTQQQKAAFGLPVTSIDSISISPSISSSRGGGGGALFMSAEGGQDEAAAADTDPVEEDAVASEEQADAASEEGEEEEEDPEIVALKEEIKNLESELRAKRSTISTLEDQCDEFTESGYYRKCADVDNYRKARELANKRDSFGSRVDSVQKILPVLDELIELEQKYEGNTYKALRGDLQSSLEKKLDVTEYSAQPGDEFNLVRYKLAEEAYDDSIPAGAIVRQVAPGLEIKGNVVRPAMVVKSLGAEPKEEEKKDQDVTDEYLDTLSRNDAPSEEG